MKSRFPRMESLKNEFAGIIAQLNEQRQKELFYHAAETEAFFDAKVSLFY